MSQYNYSRVIFDSKSKHSYCYVLVYGWLKKVQVHHNVSISID